MAVLPSVHRRLLDHGPRLPSVDRRLFLSRDSDPNIPSSVAPVHLEEKAEGSSPKPLLKKMDSIQDLFKFVMNHYRTVVFGNLGRYPNIIYDALQSIPQLNVSVQSPYYTFPTKEHHIRVLHPHDIVEECDLLVYLEPPSYQTVLKHPMARRMVIFTSHLTFKLNESWDYVSYFHGPDNLISLTKELLALQDFPVQANNPNVVESPKQNPRKAIIKGRTYKEPLESDTYFIVDLTEHKKDVLAMYLDCLDAFDFLIEHISLIDRFALCFPLSHSKQSFDNFKQKSLDRLFCQTFAGGNVTSLQAILHLLPYYQSGTIDRKFNVASTTFGGLPVVIPQTVQDACKAAIVYNLKPIVKNVFQIHG